MITLRWLPVGLAIMLNTAGDTLAVQTNAEQVSENRKQLQTKIDSICATGESPAAFVAVSHPDLDPVILASGVRAVGDDTPASVNDLVHIGSCTKAMTSVLVARLVEQGKIDWEDTVEEVAPEFAEKIAEPFRSVTIRQLLTHTARVPANAGNWYLAAGEPVHQAREKVLVDSLKHFSGPIPEWEYSNLGYALAGYLLETRLDEEWENLIRQHVFEPIGMTTAGFGPPGDKSELNQPRGHQWNEAAKSFHPVWFDNAAALGPAGTIHLSLDDWLKFCRLFTDQRPEGFLQQHSIEQLLNVGKNSYACGWIVSDQRLSHNGSNTFWMAGCQIDRESGLIVLAVVNHGNEFAGGQVASIIGRANRLYRPARD